MLAAPAPVSVGWLSKGCRKMPAVTNVPVKPAEPVSNSTLRCREGERLCLQFFRPQVLGLVPLAPGSLFSDRPPHSGRDREDQLGAHGAGRRAADVLRAGATLPETKGPRPG